MFNPQLILVKFLFLTFTYHYYYVFIYLRSFIFPLFYSASLNITLCEVSSLYKDCYNYYYYYYYYYYY